MSNIAYNIAFTNVLKQKETTINKYLKKQMKNLVRNIFRGRKQPCNIPNVIGSASRKPNPYKLIWYKQGWSENRIRKNNSKYWEWEIVHNGFKLP